MLGILSRPGCKPVYPALTVFPMQNKIVQDKKRISISHSHLTQSFHFFVRIGTCRSSAFMSQPVIHFSFFLQCEALPFVYIGCFCNFIITVYRGAAVGRTNGKATTAIRTFSNICFISFAVFLSIFSNFYFAVNFYPIVLNLL